MDDSAPGERKAGSARRQRSHWPVLVVVGGPLLGAALGAAYALAISDDPVIGRTGLGMPVELEPLLTPAQLALSLGFIGLLAGAIASFAIVGVVAVVRRPRQAEVGSRLPGAHSFGRR